MQANEELDAGERALRGQATPSVETSHHLTAYTVQRWPLAEPAWTTTGTTAQSPSGTSVLEHLAERLLSASRARHMPRGLAWLDGGGPLEDVHRRSVLTAFPTRVVECAPDTSAQEVERTFDALEPWFRGRYAGASSADTAQPSVGDEGPVFRGGWIGWFGYGLIEHLEPLRLSRTDGAGLPLLSWAYHPVWFEYDDHAHTLSLNCLLPQHEVGDGSARLTAHELERLWPAEDEAGRAVPGPTAWIHWAEDALRAPLDHTTPMWAPPSLLAPGPGLPGAAQPPAPTQASAAAPVMTPDLPREAFVAAVEQVKDAIREGEVFQANLAQRFSGAATVDPFRIHVLVRRRNPSPFGAYLEGAWGAIVCNSPERLVAVSTARFTSDAGHVAASTMPIAEPENAAGQDGSGPHLRHVLTRPIAGTRPRRTDAEEDARLVDQLRASPKERAEHTMLVDLLRNDLGRVCATGTVRVSGFQRVEDYSHVHHLVSDVEGRLMPGTTLKALVRAVFPGGTITGAPKLRSIEVIDRVEPVARSVYTGSLGYVGHDGAVDLNIMIRTLVKVGERLHIWAGAGIVADSDGAHEYDETLHKAAALMEAWATSSTNEDATAASARPTATDDAEHHPPPRADRGGGR